MVGAGLVHDRRVPHFILTLTCQDRPGIIHAVAGALLDVSANVLEQAQFTDQDSGLFAMRTRFEAPGDDAAAVRQLLEERTAAFAPRVDVRLEQSRRRALVMVSKYDHCLVDLLYRYGNGELPVEIPLIVSNHEDCRPIAERHGIPFVVLPVTPETKSEQEAQAAGARRGARHRRRRAGPLHAGAVRRPLLPAARGGSSTSTTRSCPASRAPGPTTRRTPAASSSSARPRTS